jgi:hypothetical protein
MISSDADRSRSTVPNASKNQAIIVRADICEDLIVEHDGRRFDPLFENHDPIRVGRNTGSYSLFLSEEIVMNPNRKFTDLCGFPNVPGVTFIVRDRQPLKCDPVQHLLKEAPLGNVDRLKERRHRARVQPATLATAFSAENGSRAAPDSRFVKSQKIAQEFSLNIKQLLARPERFELPTPRFVVWCSIQLSYGRGAS